MNYEKDMQIDESALDIEWLDQAPLAMKYGRIHSELQKEVSEKEEEIKVYKAGLTKSVHEDPDGTVGKSKPTIADIDAYIQLDKGHKRLQQDLIDLRYEHSMAGVARNEIAFTRKMALENLVILHGQNYFAGPRIPRNLSKEVQESRRDKAVHSGIASKMNMKRGDKNG